MEIVIIIAVIIQLALLLHFFNRLAAISRNTKRTAKSAKGSFLFDLFTTFNQDNRLQSVNETLKKSSGEESISDLVSNRKHDLIYYLNFLELLASFTGDEIEIDELSFLFSGSFRNLAHQKDIQESFIKNKRPHTENILNKYFLNTKPKS